MSQEKVERHKAEKKNRKKLNRQAKIRRIASMTAGVIVCLALAGWIGFSIYTKANSSSSASGTGDLVTTPIDIDSLSDYIEGLTVE